MHIFLGKYKFIKQSNLLVITESNLIIMFYSHDFIYLL
jgi:hypothetical protein